PIRDERSMRRLLLLLAAATSATAHAQRVSKPQPASSAPSSSATSDLARWERTARAVTITRDDWGIAHITGHTDADAVFGMVYAQAEDDFNRVETNYINSQGRLAEAEGEAEVWRDLRMKLFI